MDHYGWEVIIWAGVHTNKMINFLFTSVMQVQWENSGNGQNSYESSVARNFNCIYSSVLNNAVKAIWRDTV